MLIPDPGETGHANACRRTANLLLLAGAALGPLLAGLLSAGGWNQVFYMLMTADFLALLVRK